MEVSSVPRSTRSQRSVEPGVHGATPGLTGLFRRAAVVAVVAGIALALAAKTRHV